MPSNNSLSPADDYFNDLTRSMSARAGVRSADLPDGAASRGTMLPRAAADGGDSLPRPKRIACVVCRKRKLKCDGSKPTCGTCSRLGHDCAYEEARRKSGPKRGYVKALEARLGASSVQTSLPVLRRILLDLSRS